MILLKLQPGRNKITWLRVYDYELSPYSDSVSLRLRLFQALTSLATVTRRLILQKARRHTIIWCFDLLWAYGFRFYFTPLTGVLFAFPSRYYALSVVMPYLALDRGRPSFRQGFSGLAVLRKCLTKGPRFRLRGSHPLRPAFPCRSSTVNLCNFAGSCTSPRTLLQPPTGNGVHLDTSLSLGSSPFARRYSGNLFDFFSSRY